MEEKKNFAFGRGNFIMIAASFVIVLAGFLLMSGGGSDETHYNPEIFSTMRIKVAPVVCLIGFVSMIFGIVRKPKDNVKD